MSNLDADWYSMFPDEWKEPQTEILFLLAGVCRLLAQHTYAISYGRG